jgi:hypothetical protein
MARKPVNITLSEDVITKGELLAEAETRPSFSNLVEALIVREHARRFPAPRSRKSSSLLTQTTEQAAA